MNAIGHENPGVNRVTVLSEGALYDGRDEGCDDERETTTASRSGCDDDFIAGRRSFCIPEGARMGARTGETMIVDHSDGSEISTTALRRRLNCDRGQRHDDCTLPDHGVVLLTPTSS